MDFPLIIAKSEDDIAAQFQPPCTSPPTSTRFCRRGIYHLYFVYSKEYRPWCYVCHLSVIIITIARIIITIKHGGRTQGRHGRGGRGSSGSRWTSSVPWVAISPVTNAQQSAHSLPLLLLILISTRIQNLWISSPCLQQMCSR